MIFFVQKNTACDRKRYLYLFFVGVGTGIAILEEYKVNDHTYRKQRVGGKGNAQSVGRESTLREDQFVYTEDLNCKNEKRRDRSGREEGM